MPILMTLMFTYIFGGALAGSSTAYVQRLIPGLMVFTVLVGALIREMVRVLRPSAPLLIVTTRPDFLGVADRCTVGPDLSGRICACRGFRVRGCTRYGPCHWGNLSGAGS